VAVAIAKEPTMSSTDITSTIHNAIQSASQSLTNARGYLLEAKSVTDFRRVTSALERCAAQVDLAYVTGVEHLRKLERGSASIGKRRFTREEDE
jgi:hypothetical protein